MNQPNIQLSSITLLFVSGIAHAADVRSISQECEIALALSAAPAHMWSASGVYVLGDNGYEHVRESSNGYECIVERNHENSIIPQCFDSGSRMANLQVILDEGELVRGSSSFTDIIAQRREALQNGEYPEPGFGVAYMISDYNYVFNYQQQTMLNIAPHVMFHAPNISGEAIGQNVSAAFENRGLPFMNAEGPHGLMVSFVEYASETEAVEQACAGQLPNEAEMTVFPPEF